MWKGTPEIHRLPETLDANPEQVVRIRATLDEAYATAYAFLRVRSMTVHALATLLLTRRVLDGAEAETLVLQHLDSMGIQP